jgi:hypothetical protein
MALILTGVVAAVTVMASDFVATCAVGAVESVALIVKLKVPEVVGMPEIVPVAALKFKPTGKDPELIDHV